MSVSEGQFLGHYSLSHVFVVCNFTAVWRKIQGSSSKWKLPTHLEQIGTN